jgi:hypothetical protein
MKTLYLKMVSGSIIALFLTIFIGFSFVNREKVAGIGEILISYEENHGFFWSPVLDLILIVVSGGVLLLSAKK